MKIFNVILIIMLFLFLINYSFNHKYNNKINLMILKKNFNDKSLSLPEDKLLIQQTYKQFYSDYNIQDYSKHIKDIFEYSKSKDCKYWAFIWALYLEKHSFEYDYKFVKTDNHIFIVAWSLNKSNYYIIDQNIFNEVLVK